MPSLSPRRLVEAVLDAVHQSGWSGVLLSSLTGHPRKFGVQGPSGERIEIWVYLWTLTFGGRPTLPDEVRIQLTGVSPPLGQFPGEGGLTLLIGYEPDLGIFAGFDIARHEHFSPGSPSVQTTRSILLGAQQTGLAINDKGRGEVAFGVRPDLFMAYARHARELHQAGTDSRMLDLLVRATTGGLVSEADLQDLSAPRRRIVTTVRRYVRDMGFRLQVLDAYGYRCAVTRMQLDLVEAAHILAVPEEGSTDVVQNGICLAPTFHAAYDNALIYLDEQYVMRLNQTKVSELTEDSLIGGLETLRRSLGRIYLPQNPQQRPNLTFIRRANRLRRIDGA